MDILDEDGQLPSGHHSQSQRIIKFILRNNGQQRSILAFNIPYLLPGSSFFLKHGSIVGVYTYYESKPRSSNCALSNLATTAILIAENQINIPELVKNYAPFVDRYAIIEVKIYSKQLPRGQVFEFIHKLRV